MKYYLDEDLSPKIAELLRKQNVDCISAHEEGILQASDAPAVSEFMSQKVD